MWLTYALYILFACVFECREIEYLKKETAQRRAQEESEASHKVETENLQEKVCVCVRFLFSYLFIHGLVIIMCLSFSQITDLESKVGALKNLEPS